MSNKNSYIYQLLTKYFQTRHFQQIPTDTDKVSMYATFQNTCLYLINLITLDSDYSFDYGRYELYLETTRKQFQNVESDKIYLLNLLIADHPEKFYSLVNKKPNFDEHFIDIHWLVDCESQQLIIPESQPKGILGLEQTLADLIDSGLDYIDGWRKTSSHMYLTRFFVGVNVLFFVFMTVLGSGLFVLPDFLQTFYDTVLVQEKEGSLLWYILSIIVHERFSHLLFTSIAIYILGSRLEQYFTEVQYVIIYIISGISGALVCYLGSNMIGVIEPAVGANGAIYGMIASVLILSKAASRPLAGISDLIIWTIFIMGIVFSVVSRDIGAFANFGGFVGGLIVSIPIDWYRIKHQEE